MSDLDGFSSVPMKVAGIKVAGNRVLAPSKLDRYQHEVHPFVRLNSYGTTHLQIHGPVITSAPSHWETENNSKEGRIWWLEWQGLMVLLALLPTLASI